MKDVINKIFEYNKENGSFVRDYQLPKGPSILNYYILDGAAYHGHSRFRRIVFDESFKNPRQPRHELNYGVRASTRAKRGLVKDGWPGLDGYGEWDAFFVSDNLEVIGGDSREFLCPIQGWGDIFYPYYGGVDDDLNLWMWFQIIFDQIHTHPEAKGYRDGLKDVYDYVIRKYNIKGELLVEIHPPVNLFVTKFYWSRASDYMQFCKNGDVYCMWTNKDGLHIYRWRKE